MSKFLVTGGAGFIGSNFLHYAVSKYPNDQFVCLDALTYAGNFNNIKSLTKNDNFKFVKGNITDKNMIDNLFNEEKFDYVINFAAETHVDNSFDNADLFLKTNILGTQVLLDASLKYNVKDHISGIDLVVREVKAGEVYNFGGHAERSNIEIAEIILNYLNKPLSLINYVSDRPGNDLRYAMDSSKVEKELGWQIECNFEDGIKETIDWYVNNKKWIEDIISGEYLNSYNKEN